MLAPGGTHTFDVNFTSGGKSGAGAWTPRPLDVIEIEHVQWADGSGDGVARYNFGSVIASDGGRRLQLTRIVGIMRNAMKDDDGSAGLLTRIRTEIEALPDQRMGSWRPPKPACG